MNTLESVTAASYEPTPLDCCAIDSRWEETKQPDDCRTRVYTKSQTVVTSAKQSLFCAINYSLKKKE